MTVFHLILLVLSSACLLGATFNKKVGDVSLLALGLFLWVLVPLSQTIQALPD